MLKPDSCVESKTSQLVKQRKTADDLFITSSSNQTAVPAAQSNLPAANSTSTAQAYKPVQDSDITSGTGRVIKSPLHLKDYEL